MANFDKVKDMLVDKLGISEEKITLESEIVKDLGADSLDLVEMLLSMEEEYIVTKKNAGKDNENVKFPEEVRDKINSLLDVPEEIKNIHKNCLF